jgi:hypothetical protein
LKLIITASIKKSELKPLANIFSIKPIKSAARKVARGLGKTIKNTNHQFIKIPITSPSAAGRSLFLLQINSQKIILIMLRMKKDKKIGTNMSAQNPKFLKILKKNNAKIIEDLKNNNYEEFDL